MNFETVLKCTKNITYLALRKHLASKCWLPLQCHNFPTQCHSRMIWDSFKVKYLQNAYLCLTLFQEPMAELSPQENLLLEFPFLQVEHYVQ